MSRSTCAAPLTSRRPPTCRCPNCFGLGNGSDALFRTEIVKALLSRAGELTGLQIANAATDDGPLLKKGYVAAGQTVQAVPMAVPADYAAFTVLGR